jgi:hypothetical protein
MCGCLLADFGADVVKVSTRRRDRTGARRVSAGSDPPLSFMHETVNRNKRSLALDLHGTRAVALFHAPGGAQRRGDRELSARHGRRLGDRLCGGARAADPT